MAQMAHFGWGVFLEYLNIALIFRSFPFPARLALFLQ